MRFLLILALLYASGLYSQDKLFFKNGTSRKGIVVSNAKDFIYFKSTDTSKVEKIKKNSLVILEDYKGNRYLFSEEEFYNDSLDKLAKNSQMPRNILSVQPLAFLFGRANFSYEHLSKDGKFGLVVPIIITFDPSFGNIYNALIDSTRSANRVKGINYITGLDLNFYFGKKENVKLFAGPRFRYGTDVAFLDIEGYTLQTQLGLRVGKPYGRIVQHLSIGFGFLKIIASPALQVVDTRQAHPWYSLNYRFGIKW